MDPHCRHGGTPPSLVGALQGALLCVLGLLNLLLGSAVPPRWSIAASSGLLCGLCTYGALAVAAPPGSEWLWAGTVVAALAVGAAVGHRWCLWVLDALELVALVVFCAAVRGFDQGNGPDRWDVSSAFILSVALVSLTTGCAALLMGLMVVCPYSAIPVAVLAAGVGVVAQLAGCALRACSRGRGAEAVPLAVNGL